MFSSVILHDPCGETVCEKEPTYPERVGLSIENPFIKHIDSGLEIRDITAYGFV